MWIRRLCRVLGGEGMVEARKGKGMALDGESRFRLVWEIRGGEVVYIGVIEGP